MIGIGLTTVGLLKFIELDFKAYTIRFYYIDWTYRLVQNGYPLIVFGKQTCRNFIT